MGKHRMAEANLDLDVIPSGQHFSKRTRREPESPFPGFIHVVGSPHMIPISPVHEAGPIGHYFAPDAKSGVPTHPASLHATPLGRPVPPALHVSSSSSGVPFPGYFPCQGGPLLTVPLPNTLVVQYPYLAMPPPPMHPLFPTCSTSCPSPGTRAHVPCPLCQTRSLTLNGTIISCDCGLSIDTGHERDALLKLTRRLEKCQAEHAQSCPAEPIIALKPFLDLDNQSLIFQCHHCRRYDYLV
ncbi:hypothetical protein H4R33_002175 [Dimargaris cristalligena]|uniref:RPA-interacting protein C-terminal domain-containing protein n=1 Tax=Dimargaris cristalligena TaxID=215637 RepID=A0A4V1J5N4_9FUNG|nr:hypothetical protein H4R33_002175 [Dimargaris cristalligena]RKP39669.1 hypothetical protein BJ085DRAFT_37251 [Dimargaris cristalligena]|eukprot:RKP39669.1 hypothetical protein BJ085DRAFT_37251 [Dimargaris cristalligena]